MDSQLLNGSSARVNSQLGIKVVCFSGYLTPELYIILYYI